MIYKFRRWVYVPCVTEIFIVADTDKEGMIIDLFRTLEASRRKHNI